MKTPSSEAGSLSLQACALIFCLSLLAGAAVSMAQASRQLSAGPSGLPGTQEMELISSWLELINGDPSPGADSFHDKGLKPRSHGGWLMEPRDLSGSLHPDWCEPGIFSQAALKPFLHPGRGAEGISLLRELIAPCRDSAAAYGEIFTDEAFSRILSSWAFPAPGAFSPPRGAFLRWADALPDSPPGADPLLADLEALSHPLGAQELFLRHGRAWARWIPTHPPLNANTADPALLEALFSFCGLPGPRNLASRLVAARTSNELSLADLAANLAAPKGSRVLAILGCRSLFMECRITSPEGRVLSAVAGRMPGQIQNDPGDTRKAFHLLELRLEAQP